MKIIYVHHAERNRDKNIPRQEQDITNEGIIEAKLIEKKLSQLKIKAIYTSPYKRCIHTSQIINENIKVPIIETDFLNEMQNGETWKEIQLRTCNGIDNIIKNNESEDIIVCVTSGVNLSGFICYFTGIKPSNSNPWIQAITCSPVLFSTDNSCF